MTANYQWCGDGISIVSTVSAPLPKLLGRMDRVLHLGQLYKKKNETLKLVHRHIHTCVYLYVLHQPSTQEDQHASTYNMGDFQPLCFKMQMRTVVAFLWS